MTSEAYQITMDRLRSILDLLGLVIGNLGTREV